MSNAQQAIESPRVTVLRGELSEMIRCARGRWHSYLRCRDKARQAEDDNNLDLCRYWSDRARLNRQNARRYMRWACARQAELDATVTEQRSIPNAT